MKLIIDLDDKNEVKNAFNFLLAYTSGDHLHSKCSILDRDLSYGVDLNSILNEVKDHYIDRALMMHNDKLVAVQRSLGFPNYQTCTNWVRKRIERYDAKR